MVSAAVVVRAFEWACACGAPRMAPGPHYVDPGAALAGLEHHSRTECPLPDSHCWGVVTAAAPVLT